MVKKLAGCIREYKRDTLLTPLFMVGEVVMETIIPFVMARLIDYGIDMGSMGAIWKYGIVLVLCALLSLTFGVLSGRFAATAAAGFAKNLRHDMFYNVQRFSFSNIDRFSTASIITRLTTDVTNVQNAFMMIIRIAVRSPMMLIFSVIMAFTINVKVTMLLIAILPFLAAALFGIIRLVFPVFDRVFKTYDKLNNVVRENIRGIRVVKAYVREEHEVEKFNGVSEKIFLDFSKAEKLIAFNGPAMQLAIYGFMIGVSWLGAKMIVGGTMTTGELVSLITYAMQILMALMMLSIIFVMLTLARTSAGRICEILDEEPDLTGRESGPEVADGSIEFKDVSFSYENDMNKICLSDIDLTIRSGEVVGIIGSTGSSKTTLVQLIPRLYDVTAGNLLVGGKNVKEYNLQTLRDAVSMVLQKNVLFSGTIKDNLRWGDPDATEEEMVMACQLAQADGFIRELPDGYDTWIEQGGTNVSGGQRQRLCIARALLKKPKILILDDSTSAVDTRTDALIREAFRTYIPETTKIIIAQRISSVQEADQIIVMENGRIDAVGTHEELLASNQIYQEAYYSQVKGGALSE
ncbi:MAG: ABC transporter ATP-binding protein [Firmicutes bacterium]|nr:ABC transporter ATP-binding protein [Bacillota bacterium]